MKKKKKDFCRMWTVVLCIEAFVVIYYTHWIIKRRNPKCNGVLPQTMGLPLIGKRIQTSLAGRPVVVSADPEFNQYIVQQEGRAVEMWYLDTLSRFFGLNTEWLKALGLLNTLNHFSCETSREKMLPPLDQIIIENYVTNIHM